MRFWAILISVLIMFGGCGSAPKKYKTPKKQIIQKGKNLANGIYYFNPKGIAWVVKNRHEYLSEPYDLKKMLFGADFVEKVGKEYKLNKMSSLEPEDKKFWLYDFGYDKNKNEYSIAGKYIYATDAKYKWPIRFVGKYDATSLDLKGIYYMTHGESERVFMSDSGEHAIFTNLGYSILLNIETQKSVRFDFPKDMYSFWHVAPRFSKNGKYIAILLDEKGKSKYDNEIIIVETKTGKTKKKFRFYNNKSRDTYLYGYDFSDDEKLFFYKAYGEKFTVYDIDKTKVIKSFGVTNDINMKWEITDISVDRNYLMATYYGKYKDKSQGSKNIVYLYDISKNNVVCEIDKEYSYRTFVDEKTSTLHLTRAGGRTIIYSIGKDTCKKIGDVYEDEGESDSYSILSTSDGDTRHWFHNSEVKKFTYKKPKFTKEDIEVVEKIEKLKRLFEAGFTKKGMKELKNLILNDSYDYFGEKYLEIIEFLTDSQEVYFNVLGYQRYIKRDINIDYYHFHRAIRNYIFIASERGFKEMIPPMIEVYKKAIGNNPTKKQKDMLAVYKANYLLDIGRDEEAYELLFDISPIHVDVKKTVKNFSAWNIGLMKNRKKLSVSTGIKESDLGKAVKKKPLDIFYDLAGNRLKKGEKPKKVAEEDFTPDEPVKVTPKQNAIKLLD